jgi:hypothetical protein
MLMPKALAEPSKAPEEVEGEPLMVELPEGMAEPLLLVEEGLIGAAAAMEEEAAGAGTAAEGLEQTPPESAGGSVYSSPWLSRVDLQMLLVMP